MIEIKNVSSSIVTIIAPDYKFRRKLVPNQGALIPDEIYYSLTYETGFQTFIKNGFIKVTISGQDSVAEVFEAEGLVLTTDEIRKIYETKDVTQFAKIIPKASAATKETFAKLAIEMRVTDNAFLALIKKYCGVEVMKGISSQEGV